ncbi:hypothetical protein BJY01DRAFT_219325 [Aspergillus pseudoustus]|uniref:Uncharacterized protein n=1 Tax=Aspergillus pseudoustus TaxID=1810923 RepID=A0ABR4JGU5_9EURO
MYSHSRLAYRSQTCFPTQQTSCQSPGNQHEPSKTRGRIGLLSRRAYCSSCLSESHAPITDDDDDGDADRLERLRDGLQHGKSGDSIRTDRIRSPEVPRPHRSASLAVQRMGGVTADRRCGKARILLKSTLRGMINWGLMSRRAVRMYWSIA